MVVVGMDNSQRLSRVDVAEDRSSLSAGWRSCSVTAM